MEINKIQTDNQSQSCEINKFELKDKNKMSVNKILKKRKQQSPNPSQTKIPQGNEGPQFVPQQPKMNQQQAKLEAQFERFVEYSQYNPSSYQFSNTYMPYNASLHSKFRMPLSIVVPAVSYEMDPVQKSIDKIPRCGSCRAYMNYYNEVLKNSFKCFLCGRQNGFMGEYRPDGENIELTQPSYHVLGGDNVYQQAPPENAYIFMLDINKSSFETKALYYFVAAMKQVLSRQELNQVQIYFFTYDQIIQEYDFSGDEVKCTILDPSIGDCMGKRGDNFLQNIRGKLFELLDSLQEMAENNKKQGSNFVAAFNYVFESVKHTGGKMFILQSNEAIIGQQMFNDNAKKPGNEVEPKPKSFLQLRNREFFNKYIQQLLTANISFSMFVFQKNYKNLRVLSDTAKLTSSQLYGYRKDSPQDLMKFYYDISYLLGASYYGDAKMELISSPGWLFTAVYGNLYRIKDHITFKFCHLEPSRRVFVCVQPQQVNQLPYFAMQIITNYLYNRQHFVTVNTVVLPVTTSLEKLYSNQQYTLAATTLHRTFLSSLRLQEINMLRNKFLKHMAAIYKCASDYYKKVIFILSKGILYSSKSQKLPQQINTLMLSQLALLKSCHFQLQSINETIALDHVVTQRNVLQSCGPTQLQNFFSPYLFNLSSMTPDMCQDDQNFVYPQVCELKFSSVKEGIYLMDNGLALYLYVSKVCEPILIKKLFGKEKLSKGDNLSEDTLNTNTDFGLQVTNLIRICREQKSFGWIPLYIVRCGQGSTNEKTFYMNFYAEKYEQFKGCKMNLSEFITMLSQQQY